MNMSAGFARNAILGMWLGAVAIVIYKEFGNTNNPSRPLPRPCKLYPGAIGYTGLGLMAEVSPPLAFLVALGITIGELVSDAGISGVGSTIFDSLASSIQSTTKSAESVK